MQYEVKNEFGQLSYGSLAEVQVALPAGLHHPR